MSRLTRLVLMALISMACSAQPNRTQAQPAAPQADSQAQSTVQNATLYAAYVRWLAVPDWVQTPEDLVLWLAIWKVVLGL